MENNFKDPKDRQKFLQDRINRNLVVKKIKDHRDVINTIGDNMFTSLADFMENKDEQEYRKLLEQYNRLRA